NAICFLGPVDFKKHYTKNVLPKLHKFMRYAQCLGIQLSVSDILLRQKRNWVIETFTFDEGYNGPYPLYLGRVSINIATDIRLTEIHGPGVDKEPLNLFKIDNMTAKIWVMQPVDREKHDHFKVISKNQKGDINEEMGINVDIIDTNDNEPKFNNHMYEVTIEETPSQSKIFIFHKSSHFKTEFSVTLQKAQKYTLIVKATDHGQPKPLSSFTTVIINIADGNRHLPVFTKQKGEASVKEGLQGVLISRLQVTDEDTRGTKAWRAKYKIQGDTNNNFRIDTDPETNEGLLYVQKALDYEEDPLKNIIISSENEIPYFTCVTGTKEMRLSTYYLTVNVEDVNEPPVFDPSNKTVTVFEDVALGYYLEILIAKDPDVNGANQIRYMIGEDPAGFVTVDSNSGKIITSKSLDRESQFVKDGLYVIKIYATDNGEPSHTGTATLSIKIIDVNDNAPSLDKSFIDMCQRDKISSVSVTALDPDTEPYSGPFSFKLLGDLVNEHNASQTIMIFGHYELQLEVSDLQGKTAVHSLSVSVCKCSKTTKPDCRLQKDTGSRLGPGALGILFLSFLLLTFLMSCKPERIPFPDDISGQYLIMSNTEGPGSDCKVNFLT
uniref:Cadherin domain-containing protein n=1 Tax=Xiphophorus maculatus TaxID=8083 RepID=A0A3B5R8Z4_XIPMA